MVSLGAHATSVPSVLFAAPSGTFLVGDAAVRRGLAEPERVAREFKRRFGDDVPLLLGGVPFGAGPLLGRLLAWVVGSVSELEGGPPERVTVTHPANWGPYKLELLVGTARAAGLDEVTLAPEPVTAAMSYAARERVDLGEIVAVYDLGGGTFDAAVLGRTGGGFEILGAPQGVEQLGGVDFDAAVLAHVLGVSTGERSEVSGEDELRMVRALARLRQECIEAKEALSFDPAVSIDVALGRPTEVRLTRSEFESMIRAPLARSIEALERALTSASVSPAQLSSVLLVGGSSRIPLVAEMVTSALGRPVAIDAHPKHAVALGAALMASVEAVAVPAPTAVVPPPPAQPFTRADPPKSTSPGPVAPTTSGNSAGPPPRWNARVVAVALAVFVLGMAALVTVLPGGDAPEGDDELRQGSESAPEDDGQSSSGSPDVAAAPESESGDEVSDWSIIGEDGEGAPSEPTEEAAGQGVAEEGASPGSEGSPPPSERSPTSEPASSSTTNMPPPGGAPPTTSGPTTITTEVVVLSLSEGPPGDCQNSLHANGSWYAQGFVPTVPRITSAQSVIFVNTGASTLQASIVADDPNGPTVATTSVTLNPGLNSWFTMDFGNVTVTVGRTYYLKMLNQSSNKLVVYDVCADSYPSGRAWRFGPTYGDWIANDLAVKVFGRSG